MRTAENADISISRDVWTCGQAIAAFSQRGSQCRWCVVRFSGIFSVSGLEVSVSKMLLFPTKTNSLISRVRLCPAHFVSHLPTWWKWNSAHFNYLLVLFNKGWSCVVWKLVLDNYLRVCTLSVHSNTAIKWLSITTVQFKMVSMRSEKPICDPPLLSDVSPTVPFKRF